jgi:hypothetical protein
MEKNFDILDWSLSFSKFRSLLFSIPPFQDGSPIKNVGDDESK